MQILAEKLKSQPFHLSLSSGFFGFFAHAGVLAALVENGLSPASISGSSAGALVGGSWAAGVPLSEFQKLLFNVERKDFWDPGFGFGLLKGKLFRKILAEMVKVQDIENCKVPLAISVFDVLARKNRVLREGNVVDAIYASCAVPGLFHPVWIEGRPYIDGGLADRPALEGAPKDMPVLYHHLESRRLNHADKSPDTYLPKHTNTMSLVIRNLPAVNPFKLHVGKQAYAMGFEEMSRKLERPAASGLLL